MLGIGFDSGGSRTTYALASSTDVQEVTGNEAGASISNSRDRDSMDMAISWIMDVIEAREEEEICVWIGAAGFSAATSKVIASRFEPRINALRRRCEEEDRSVSIFIANDAVALLKAPPLNGSGVVAIVGTGSVILGSHVTSTEGVIKRGGYEWLVSDEGAGVWMTLQAIRLLLRDIEERGSSEYHSALLDRLADYVGVSESDLGDIPSSHRALAKADAIARKMAENRTDMKRFFARFAYPHIFDLVSIESGKSHDRIAADVLNQSVSAVVEGVRVVSESLAAYTADEPNLRESMPLILGGNIAAHPLWEQRFRVQVSASCRYISSAEMIGSSSSSLASLALNYLGANDKERRQIAKSFDPLHTIVKLM